MPRRKKIADSEAIGVVIAPDGLADRLHAFAESTLKHLDEQQAVLNRRLRALRSSGGEGFDPHLAQAGAALARARSSALAELRKLEKHDQTMAKTPAQRFALVKEYLRVEAFPAQRAEVMAMLAGMAEQRSVLS